MKKFSVLLSIYAKENAVNLKQAFDSIFNQTIAPSEVILVKDGLLTTDLDEIIDEYLSKYPILKVVSLNENKGLGLALNEGLKHCSYDWVARMDTDDICFPNRFEEQLKIIEKYPDVSFIGSSVAEFRDTPQEITSYRILPKDHDAIFHYAKARCPLNHPTVMYKKQVVIDLGGYGEFPEDYHLWIRALMSGYKFYNIQEPLLYFRINLDTIKRRGGWRYAISELRHQREFYKMGFLSFSEYLKNCTIRFCVRLIPAYFRQKLYSNLLRTK